MKLFTRHEPYRIQVTLEEKSRPVVIQNAYDNHKPYIHPIMLPGQRSSLTENQPYHHQWQHGIFSGLHGVNGWDFWNEGMGSKGLDFDGVYKVYPLEKPVEDDNKVSWFIKTDWNSPQNETILTEYQYWTMYRFDEYYLFDLDWVLDAKQDIIFDECGYGGMFIRMPWRKGKSVQAIDSEGRGRAESEGKCGRWVAVSMELDHDDETGGIAYFDHPENDVYPMPWRVDIGYGMAPSRCILGPWELKKGEKMHDFYRMFMFKGNINKEEIEAKWNEFSKIQKKMR